MSITSSDMGLTASNASSIFLRAPNMILRGMRNPDRLYRVAQMTPQLSPANLQPASIYRQRSGSWNGPTSQGDSTDSSIGSAAEGTEMPQKQFEGILAFVNVKSGGGHGKKLIKQLGQMIGRQNVYELGQPGFDPIELLRERSYDNVSYRIMACGGDGTSAWLFDSLDKSNLLGQHKVAVIPLGTGLIWHLSRYVTAYMRELVGSSTMHLYEQISLELDGVSMDARLRYLKPDTLLFLNIKSYAGGCRPWGGPNELSLVSYFDKWKPQRQDDGLLEVIGYSFLEFGDIVLGGRGHRIGQCRTTRLTMKAEIPVKVDGEPLMLGPCTVMINRKNQGVGIRKPKIYSETSMLGKLASSCGLGVSSTEETITL